MKTYILFPLLLFAAEAVAEPPVAPSSAEITSGELKQAMTNAGREYESVLQNKVAPNIGNQPQLSQLVATLAANRKPEERSVLTDLAKQVDELRNRLVVERATLLATQTPRNVKVNGARTVFNYREDSVYRVSSSVDYVTDIQLKPGERITSPPTAGDTVRWTIAVMESKSGSQQTTHIILKPTETDIETNLIIATDQHIYHLALRSGGTHMPAVLWNYPEDNEARLQAALKKERASEATVTPENLRFSYEISGDEVPWKPLRVFDDGLKTFIQMPRQVKVNEAPVLFIVEPLEEPLLVNYRVEGDYYIVDRLFENAQLVVGTKKKVLIALDDGKSFFERLFW